ncbi:MAG: hypothetical protein ABUS57_10410 [Pseudomonadota bacterium]
MRRVFLLGLLSLALSACAAPQAKGTYTGTLDWSFETSAFRTDDGQGPWWLSAEGNVWPQVVAPIQSASTRPWGHLHITVEGTLSRRGHYGHLGRYEHELRVSRVIESRLQPTGS